MGFKVLTVVILGRDQKYSLSGDCKRNVNYGTCIKYPDLDQCHSRFSLFKFLINVSNIFNFLDKIFIFFKAESLFRGDVTSPNNNESAILGGEAITWIRMALVENR